MRSEAAVAGNIQAFIEKLAGDLEPPPDGSSWREFARLGQKPAGRLPVHRPQRVGQRRPRERVRRLLDEFAAADSIHNRTTLPEFRQLVGELMQSPFGHLGPTGQGIFVSSFAGAAGMSFDAVWLVGMVEGAVPPAPRRDPLLTESDWSAAGGR